MKDNKHLQHISDIQANKESLPNYKSNSRILASMSLMIYIIGSQKKIILWDEDL